MTVTIKQETPLQDDVRELVAQLNAHLLPLSPIEFQFKMTVEQMAGADTTVFVARDESGRAVGMGALKVADNAEAEVKRAMVASGRRVVVLADSTKLGHVHLVRFADLDVIDVLVTDDGITDADVAALEAREIDVVIA